MIIGVSGKMRSGKDRLVDHLITVYGGERLAFARVLKQVVTLIWGEREKDALSRLAWQTVGEAVRGLDPDAWVKAWSRSLLRVYGPDVLISRTEHVYVPDVRYPNEMSIIHAFGGSVIRLNVSEQTQIDRGATGPFTHVSETALDDRADWFDLRVPEVESALVDQQVDAWLRGVVRIRAAAFERDPEAAALAYPPPTG